MTSLFSALTTNELEETKDSLGGFSVLETDIYDATIKAMYVTYSGSGAMAMNVVADISGREYRETIYITNRDGKNWYMNKHTNKKTPLPGFVTINEICYTALGKELSGLDAEEKVVKLWDREQKAEVPTTVPMIVDMIGTKVALAITKEVVDKTVKDANGNYVPNGETREQNTISKAFSAETHCTMSETKEGKESAFYDKWLEKYKGVTRNRAKGAANAGQSGSPVTTQKAKKSLFS